MAGQGELASEFSNNKIQLDLQAEAFTWKGFAKYGEMCLFWVFLAMHANVNWFLLATSLQTRAIGRLSGRVILLAGWLCK